MENNKKKLDDDAIDKVSGGAASSANTVPENITCPKCGYGKAWARSTWRGTTIYNCCKCDYDWEV